MAQLSRLFALALLTGCTACAALRPHALAIRPVGEAAVAGTMTGTVAAGDAMLARGEYGLAIEAYRQAIYDDPSNAKGYNGMAIAYASIGRYDLSGRFFELALSRAPTDTKIYRNLARSLDQQGRHEEALAVQRDMEDAVRLAAATTAANTVELATVAPERPSLAALARGSEQPSTEGQEEAKSSAVPGAPHLERQSLGEVKLVTAKPRPAAPVSASRAPTKPQKTAQAEHYDPKFSRLWAIWSTPRPAGGGNS